MYMVYMVVVYPESVESRVSVSGIARGHRKKMGWRERKESESESVRVRKCEK